MRNDQPRPDDRIAKLSQRFKTHAVGRRPQNTRTRERQSLYLDTELMVRAGQVYRDLSHQLYPQTVSKSAFWEALLSYGLDHVADIKRLVADAAADGELSGG
jgi:hypothetical protein